jgi:formate transporter
VHNLVPVTLGNIVGGAGFVGFVYWVIYRAALDKGAWSKSPGSTLEVQTEPSGLRGRKRDGA